MLSMKRPFFRVIRAFIILIAILFCFMFWEFGEAMRFLPRYQEKNLLGLSPDQVIARLGEPDYDPRKAFPLKGKPSTGWNTTQPSWTSEEESGPLVLGYYLRWTTCRIEFHNDHVVNVQIYGK